MAHGDKKWIVTYDGTVKRSNNRTKLDYYRDLEYWASMDGHAWGKRVRQFCPQCKHVMKHIAEERADYNAARQQIENDYIREHGPIIHRHRPWGYRDGLRYLETPAEYAVRQAWYDQKYGKKVVFFNDFAEAHPAKLPYRSPWHHHWRSSVCFKCERKTEVQDTIWNHATLGKNKTYTYRRKQNYRYYRAEVKRLMHHERYDEISPYMHEWLD